MKLDRLTLFDLVLRSGSFAEAARRCDLDPSSVSRSIAALETEVGVRLIARNTRQMRATPAGERFHAEIVPHLNALEQALHQASGEEGVIRLTASTTFTRLCLMPTLADFQRDHPEVKLEVRATDRPIDLVDERIDIALRHGRLMDSALLARKVRNVDYWCVGSPKFDGVQSPDDLKDLPHLVFDLPDFRDAWSLSYGRTRKRVDLKPALRTDNADALLSAALSGMGVSVLADWTVRADIDRGTLVRLLPNWTLAGPVQNPALWLVTPTRKQRPERVQKLMNVLMKKLAQ